MAGFRKFLLRGNVLDLAVAVVLGSAFTAVITAIVKGLITPLLGVFGGLPSFSSWVVTVNRSEFAVGEVVNALVAFLVIALVLYFLVVVPVNRMMDRVRTPVVATRECPECLSKVPVKARRCMYCTSELPAVGAEPVIAG